MISYGKQSIDSTDIEAVVDILKSSRLTQGPVIEKFERAVADYCGVKYAVAVNSGTAALHLACLCAGLKEGEELLTSPMSFAATANCALYCGARPVFADIREDWPHLELDSLRNKISSRTKVLIGVDYGGLPENHHELIRFCKENSLIYISDAAHSIGAKYKGRKTGGIADMTIFSFHPVKTITTGEGGMILTDHSVFYERLKAFRSHGVVKNTKMMEKTGPWFYEMRDLGFNYRITDMQCALGLSQMKRISSFSRKRNDLALRYLERFKNIPNLIAPFVDHERTNAWHLFPLRIKFDSLKKNKVDFFHFMKENGVLLQVHYIPINQHPYYKKLGYDPKDTPAADLFYQREVSLPLYPDLTFEEQDKVVRLVETFIGSSEK